LSDQYPPILLSTLGTPAWDCETVAARARQYGYRGVDMRLLDGEVITLDSVRANAERLRRLFPPIELPIAVFATSVRLAQSTSAAGDPMVADALAWIETARELGVPMVRFFGGPRRPGASVDDAVAAAADMLNRVAPAAEQAGIVVGVETHDDFSSAEVVARTLELVPSRHVGAIWDMHHTYRMGESPRQALELLDDRIVNIHVKDARRTDDGWQLLLAGAGELPIREGLSLALDRGYRGYVTVEWEKKWHPEIEDPEIAYPQHMDYLRSYFADRPSQDR
jgi:sugar phosphate isomerase/epimerase